MLFRSVATVLAGVLFAQGTLGAVAALTPAQVVANIQVVATISGNLSTSIAALPTVPNAQSFITFSQQVVSGFQTIIQDLAGDVTAMQATPPFSDNVAGLVVAALKDFVTIHQALLATIIGRHTLFAQFGLTAPIAAVLRTLEAGIDTFALGMINLIPTRTTDVANDQNNLDTSIKNTITQYSQLCIPSVLYPTIPPICVTL